MGAAAWRPSMPRAAIELSPRRVLVMPTTFALLALGLLVYAGFHHVSDLGVALAGLTVLLVIVRAAWTFRENLVLLESSQHEAVTDALTGLGNRRQMTQTLAAALADGSESPRAVLLMFDLDGFKLYNDQFGHLAGDTMLAHLGQRAPGGGDRRRQRVPARRRRVLRAAALRSGGRRRPHRGARTALTAERGGLPCVRVGRRRRTARARPSRRRTRSGSPTTGCTPRRATAAARPASRRTACCSDC